MRRPLSSAPEVVWGVGTHSSGPDDVVVAGFTPAISAEWQASSLPDPDGPYYGGALARIGGGAGRLIFMTPETQATYGGMRALALDPVADTLEFSREIGSNWLASRAIDVVDYDNDNVDELFLGSSESQGGYFAVYDFATDTVEWQSPLTGRNESPVAMTHADVNGDGYQDLIGLTSNGYIYVYDVHAQSLVWKSTGLGGYGIDIQAADLDGDDAPEIYAIRSVYINPSTLQVYDGELHPIRSVPLGVRAGVLFVDDSNFQRKNLLIGTGQAFSNGTSELWAVDPVTGADVWRSPMLIGQIALDSLRYADVDGDGRKEISFGTTQAMYVTR
jgi:hypothetical protein